MAILAKASAAAAPQEQHSHAAVKTPDGASAGAPPAAGGIPTVAKRAAIATLGS
eukprot:CAMPEP_0172155052 /NCGR_PEP_ID=MMETSP1050-20130122/2403_1 /TAXON_ID=233186 /ORGANISM="Cryptomonas curvata, Strain CCAP979/52" /LENGTH=53 /DNA_ID=CAMNT_0012823891 /DNA_START=581 /DNA_END=738 /DNA_ORIENTATION=-